MNLCAIYYSTNFNNNLESHNPTDIIRLVKTPYSNDKTNTTSN